MVRRELDRFLGASDLDNLQAAHQALLPLSDDDVVTVRAMLACGDDRQAVANLLLRPSVLPDDLRLAALLEALASPKHPYFTLAAVVGLQSVDAAKLPPDVRRRIRDSLLDVIVASSDVRASRASVTVEPLLSEADAPRVAAYVLHPDRTTAHNIITWLIRTFLTEVALSAVFDEVNRGDEARAVALAQLREHQAKPGRGEPQLER